MNAVPFEPREVQLSDGHFLREHQPGEYTLFAHTGVFLRTIDRKMIENIMGAITLWDLADSSLPLFQFANSDSKV